MINLNYVHQQGWLRRSRFRFLVLLFSLSLGSLFFQSTPSEAAKKASTFSLVDGSGKEHSLSKYQGKWVVLEWYNPGCPFVKKHYESGNMQALQKKWGKKGVIWLSVISSAPGKQGFAKGKNALALKKKHQSHQKAILLDPSGKVGRKYGAKTTPHMYVINPKGELVYEGAIDDRATTDVDDVQGAKNYVSLALTQGLSGQKIDTAKTKPYGCSVKYQ